MSTLIKNLQNPHISSLLTPNEEQTGVSIKYGFNSGGYESNVYFVTQDSGVLSIQTVINEINDVDFNDENDSSWFIVGYDVNYENQELYDDHTNELIPAAYEDE